MESDKRLLREQVIRACFLWCFLQRRWGSKGEVKVLDCGWGNYMKLVANAYTSNLSKLIGIITEWGYLPPEG